MRNGFRSGREQCKIPQTICAEPFRTDQKVLLPETPARYAGREEADADPEQDDDELLQPEQLGARLQELNEQLGHYTPPEGFTSWTAAVQDAAGAGPQPWQVGNSFIGGWSQVGAHLLTSSYHEVFVTPELQIRPSTAGQFDPVALLQAQLQQQQQQQQQIAQQIAVQQQLAAQQQLLRAQGHMPAQGNVPQGMVPLTQLQATGAAAGNEQLSAAAAAVGLQGLLATT
jgi:hypothetical protein